MQNNQNILYTPSKLKIEETQEGKFLVFDDTKMGPYSHLFHKDNTLYDDEINFRGSKKFPFQPKNGMTEIFLATEKIIIACGQRKNIKGVMKSFVDIVTADKLKYRIEIDEVVLIYNSMIDNKEVLIMNYCIQGEYKTITININDLKIQQTKEETIVCEFNMLSQSDKKNYLIFFKDNDYLGNMILEGYFILGDKNNTDDFILYLLSKKVGNFIGNIIGNFIVLNKQHIIDKERQSKFYKFLIKTIKIAPIIFFLLIILGGMGFNKDILVWIIMIGGIFYFILIFGSLIYEKGLIINFNSKIDFIHGYLTSNKIDVYGYVGSIILKNIKIVLKSSRKIKSFQETLYLDFSEKENNSIIKTLGKQEYIIENEYISAYFYY